MKKEYIVSRIEASQDGSPYVYVTFTDPTDFMGGSDKQQNTFGPNMMAFTSPEDMMKNLPKAMANVSRVSGGGGGYIAESPTFKVSMREYEDLSIKVGDKANIEIRGSDSTGI